MARGRQGHQPRPGRPTHSGRRDRRAGRDAHQELHGSVPHAGQAQRRGGDRAQGDARGKQGGPDAHAGRLERPAAAVTGGRVPDVPGAKAAPGGGAASPRGGTVPAGRCTARGARRTRARR